MIDSTERTLKVWLNLYLLLELYDKQGTSYGLRLIGSCSVPGMNYCYQQKLPTEMIVNENIRSHFLNFYYPLVHSKN